MKHESATYIRLFACANLSAVLQSSSVAAHHMSTFNLDKVKLR